MTYMCSSKDSSCGQCFRKSGLSVEHLGEKDVSVELAGKTITLNWAKLKVKISNLWQEQKLEAVIFDLDGVLVTTDKYHYLAWKELADELGLSLMRKWICLLRGVSRTDNMRIIYRENNQEAPADEVIDEICSRKNDVYLKHVKKM